jgi:cytochrome c556
MYKTTWILLALGLALPAVAGKGKEAPPPPNPAPSAPAPAGAATPAAQSVVTYRHVLMEGLGKHMKGASMIVKGEIDRPGDMLLHAHALSESARAIPTLFPKGSEPAVIKSDSRPEVWTAWDDFLAKNKEYEAATQKLLDAAKANDLAAFKAAFGPVGASCGACHDKYRIEE